MYFLQSWIMLTVLQPNLWQQFLFKSSFRGLKDVVRKYNLQYAYILNFTVYSPQVKTFNYRKSSLFSITIRGQHRCFTHVLWVFISLWLFIVGSIIVCFTCTMQAVNCSWLLTAQLSYFPIVPSCVFQKERRLLENLRLDLDSCKARLKKAKVAEAKAAVSLFVPPNPQPHSPTHNVIKHLVVLALTMTNCLCIHNLCSVMVK